MNETKAHKANKKENKHKHNKMASTQDTHKAPADKATTTTKKEEQEQTVQHPLNSKWTVWFDFSAQRSASWEANLRALMEVGTVEDWWALYDRLPKMTELEAGSNVSVFRQGIRPVPGDAANKDGGMYKVQGFSTDSFDSVWLRSVLFCIGEVGGAHWQAVNGVVGSIRVVGGKAVQSVSLWINTNELKDEKGVKQLGKLFKEQIGLGARKTRLPFKPHNDANLSQAKAAKKLASTTAASAAKDKQQPTTTEPAKDQH